MLPFSSDTTVANAQTYIKNLVNFVTSSSLASAVYIFEV
jgi:hypothetical protein